MPDLLEEQRENWGSRAGFVLAAIGSAVGLGNLWGFPYKVYDHGGGAFLIPYVFAMIAIGVPLMILEFSLGHMTQRAAPDAYRGINRRTEPVGWWGVLLGFVIITYYPVILAYCGSYLIECFRGIFANGGELAWKGQGLEGVENHWNAYLNAWPKDAVKAGEVRPWEFGWLVSPIVISLAVIWGLMYLCICRGVRMVSKVVLITVPLPWIMLLILTVRGLTLPGAARGLNFYLDPDFSHLAEPETWRWAFGQMFFSMSLAFGVMVTYASFLHRKSDLNNNATIIGLADVGTSFVAGVAVFATLGAMAFATQQAADAAGDPNLAMHVTHVVKGGPGLAFVAFPYALAQLPYSAWFGAVFFLALLTLGIDSAFSITESVLASLVDKTRRSRGWLLVGITVVGFGLGLVYCTRGGLSWLGAIDAFINEPHGGIVLLGLLEAAVVGWAYRIKRLREHANERSDWRLGFWWDIIIRYVAPILLSALFTWSVLKQAARPGGFLWTVKGDVWVFQTPALVSLIVAIAVPVLAVILSCIRSPGADRHAQHLGQPRAGRAAGVVGLLFVLAAVAVAAYSFYESLHARWATADWGPDTPRKLADAVPLLTLAGWQLPRAAAIAAGAGLLALVGIVLGAGVVARCEARQRRPSGFARAAAGAGVMTFGGACGLMLAMFVLLHKLAELQAKAGQPAPEQAKELDHLTTPSWVVLAVMAALLVVGLGWCFYRAIKAAGGTDEEAQLPEDSQ